MFTHALARRELAAAGWQPTPGGPWLIGQHHSQFASLSDESWLIEALPRLFSDVDGFTALTDEDAGSFGELIGVPAFGMPNPLRPAGLPPRHPEKLAVALARYSPEKQLDVMIRAFSQATEAPSLNGWKLELHGEGPTRPQLEAMIESLGIADRVRLAGPTTDIQSVLARAQVNLLTSRYEGFGMSILEAADAGVPSVVFDCSAGVRSLVPQGAGLLVPPNDEEAFAASLRTLLLDPELRSAMGRAAQHHSASFSPARIAQRWGHMLARVTGA
ncbi:MAG: glycosyltransferase [Propionibacteriaceae bacterium]|nr:glycosyltransferase [Propionibacteriaceae bacterium]